MTLKTQSAMGYLMTYGWAIVVIAVVIAALFSLGLFNTANGGISSTCEPVYGYLCSNLALASNGMLSATIGSSLYALSNVQSGCGTVTSSPTSWTATQGNVLANLPTPVTFSCPITSNTLGSSYTETLWIEYTQNGQTQTAKIGTAVVKVSVVSQASAPVVTFSSNEVYSGSGSPSITMAPGANTYICEETTTGGGSAILSWIQDFSVSGNFISVGHQSSNVCSATGIGVTSLIGVGVSGGTADTPFPQLASSTYNYGLGEYTFSYTVGDSNQVTLIVTNIGSNVALPVVTPSSGTCTPLVDYGTGLGWNLIYECSGQTPGTYSVAISSMAYSNVAYVVYAFN